MTAIQSPLAPVLIEIEPKLNDDKIPVPLPPHYDMWAAELVIDWNRIRQSFPWLFTYDDKQQTWVPVTRLECALESFELGVPAAFEQHHARLWIDETLLTMILDMQACLTTIVASSMHRELATPMCKPLRQTFRSIVELTVYCQRELHKLFPTDKLFEHEVNPDLSIFEC